MLIRPQQDNKKPSASFKPDFIAKSVSDIDFAYLKNLGITTCFVDLDGTVVDRGAFEVSIKTKTALRNSGLDIKIATNRPRSRSLKELKKELSATGVIHPHGLYGKPTKTYIKHALKETGLQRHEVVMIGDRFVQDIFGANRSGIYSLLVFKLGSSIGRVDALISNSEQRFARHLARKYASYQELD